MSPKSRSRRKLRRTVLSLMLRFLAMRGAVRRPSNIEHGEHFLVIQREARVLLGRPGSRRLLHFGQVSSGHRCGVDGVRVRYRGGQKAV